MHEVTSDHYFTEIANGSEPFDLIYLDGLHTFEQTFRDFCASLRYSHERTIWLVDDTMPVSFLASFRNPRLARWVRMRLGIKNKSWMGDVYKVVFAIHDFFPQFSYATLDHPGQTVLWMETRRNFGPSWSSLAAITNLGYRDYLRLKETHLNLSEAEALYDKLRAVVGSRAARRY